METQNKVQLVIETLKTDWKRLYREAMESLDWRLYGKAREYVEKHIESVIDSIVYANKEYPYDDIDDLLDDINETISYQEIVYYARAMEYLSDADPSLTESLQLAHDYGYECRNMNSEWLATFHLQDMLQDILPTMVEIVKKELSINN